MKNKRKEVKPWNRYKSGRPTGNRGTPKKRILIVCEGEKTEPNYFKSFRITSATVIVKGIGMNTTSLISEIISLRDQATNKDERYDEVWCVFDKDSFSNRDFNDAIQIAKGENIMIAYSNEAFELWYILHFNFLTSALSRTQYIKRLAKYLGKKYEKNSKEMYNELLEKQTTAIKNAKRLMQTYSHNNPALNNPSTTVFELVEELNKNI